MKTLLLAICCCLGVSGRAADPVPSPVGTASVVVFGDVRSPGKLQWSPDLTVLSAIERCGGFGWKEAKKGFISRGDEFIDVPVGAMLRGKEPDVKLQPGDTLVFDPPPSRPREPRPNLSPIRPLPDWEFLGEVKLTLGPALPTIWRSK